MSIVSSSWMTVKTLSWSTSTLSRVSLTPKIFLSIFLVKPSNKQDSQSHSQEYRQEMYRTLFRRQRQLQKYGIRDSGGSGHDLGGLGHDPEHNSGGPGHASTRFIFYFHADCGLIARITDNPILKHLKDDNDNIEHIPIVRVNGADGIRTGELLIFVSYFCADMNNTNIHCYNTGNHVFTIILTTRCITGKITLLAGNSLCDVLRSSNEQWYHPCRY